MSQAVPVSTTNSVITVSDLDTTISDEPRVLDLRLAEALGFTDRHMIRALIRRHMKTLRTLGEVVSRRKKPTAKGGRTGTEYWLNEEQALFITAKSDTERAALVTLDMVRVFKAYLSRSQVLPPPSMKALPAPEAPQHNFMDLFTAACAAFNEWRRFGIVTDHDKAMWIAMQAVFDVAGVDADVGRVAGLKRRR